MTYCHSEWAIFVKDPCNINHSDLPPCPAVAQRLGLMPIPAAPRGQIQGLPAIDVFPWRYQWLAWGKRTVDVEKPP